MKSYKDFISHKPVEQEPEIVIEQSLEPEILELEELPNLLGEAQNQHEPTDPPNILVMRRVSIRQYPNNQRVALYFVDKINKYVTVPYTAMQWSSSGIATQEETEKNIIDQLIESSNSSVATKLIFENDSSLFINSNVAKQMLKLYNSLNEENKKEYVQIAGRSKADFLEIKNFSDQ